MGDIADLVVEGILCEGCGVLLISEGEAPLGIPSLCEVCAEDEDDSE